MFLFVAGKVELSELSSEPHYGDVFGPWCKGSIEYRCALMRLNRCRSGVCGAVSSLLPGVRHGKTDLSAASLGQYRVWSSLACKLREWPLPAAYTSADAKHHQGMILGAPK